MEEELNPLKPKRRNLLVGLAFSFLFIIMFVLGYWILEQTMNSVVIFRRDYVHIPILEQEVDVWRYHDLAYLLLWLSYTGFISLELTPWRDGQLTRGIVLISLIGFASLTAGLWLNQDTMNAVLSLNRNFVDPPFFIWKLDLYNARDLSRLLVILGFVSFFSMIHNVKHQPQTPSISNS